MALRSDRRDYVPMKLEDEESGSIELEAARHRRSQRPDRGEAIRPERRQSVVIESEDLRAARPKGSGKGKTAKGSQSGAVASSAPEPPLPPDPFGDLLTLDGLHDSTDEAGDSKMQGNKRPSPDPAPVAKKSKPPGIELPAGATVISNEGGGNCLPAAMAQALSSHQGRQVKPPWCSQGHGEVDAGTMLIL